MRLVTYFMLILGLLMIFISMRANAADINCSDGACSFGPSLDIRNDSTTPQFSQFEVRELNEDLAIATPDGTSPRSTKMYFETIDPDGQNMILSLPSSKKLNSAGSAVIIGQSIKDLTINLNGRSGDATPSASSVCAAKIIAGDYGAQVKSRYLLARFNDPLLPTDRCVPTDLVSIQNNEFTCIAGQSEFNGTGLQANRWTKRRSCGSESERRMCLKRRMRVKCTWTAERFSQARNGCSPSEPNGTATLNPSPKGPGFNGKPWVCDPAIASTTASGWKLDIDPYIVDESWVQSRRLAGKTDENICDELTGRNTTYLNSFTDITYSIYRNKASGSIISQTPNAFSGNPDGMQTINVDRGYWWGKSSSSNIRNPLPNEVVPASTYMISGSFAACYSGGSHSWLHLRSVVQRNSCRGFVNNVAQTWTGYTKYGGKGHTVRSPSGLTCYADVANNRMVCNYTRLGEAFSTAHRFNWVLYGPHGKKFNMIYTKGNGRY